MVVVRMGLRRVRVRCSLPPHPGLAGGDENDDAAGARLPGDGVLDQAPRGRRRLRRTDASHRCRQRLYVHCLHRPPDRGRHR
ncbi:MAG: hypothetical protein CMF57_05035, partial [Leifsonia sp.]|nr:hypothetical protein [Leifsonia sp.]